MMNSCSAAPEPNNNNEVEELRQEWDALSREEKRKRALEFIQEGHSKRGLAKALNISEATLRYYLSIRQGKSANSASAPVPPSGKPANTAEASLPERPTRPALSADTEPATKASNSVEVMKFLNEIDTDGVMQRAAARRQQDQETAHINDLVLAFAGFLVQNCSLEPQPCLHMVGLIASRLNEAELSRHLPRPLPAGTDARRFLARIPPQPHTEGFEQVVYRAVVGLLYLAPTPEMRRQVLRGLGQGFRSEIQYRESLDR